MRKEAVGGTSVRVMLIVDHKLEREGRATVLWRMAFDTPSMMRITSGRGGSTMKRTRRKEKQLIMSGTTVNCSHAGEFRLGTTANVFLEWSKTTDGECTALESKW